MIPIYFFLSGMFFMLGLVLSKQVISEDGNQGARYFHSICCWVVSAFLVMLGAVELGVR